MSSPDRPAAPRRGASRRASSGKRVIRLLQVALALSVAFAAWFIAFGRGSDEAAPVLPNTGVQFSLDLKVVGQMNHGLVYAVEQRARPAYRIFSFDPATGAATTVFTVPEDAIVYGIALSPDGATLAVSYSTDFHVKGSGLWTLDLATKAFTEIRSANEGSFLVDPAWSADGTSIYTTSVDRTGADEQLSTARVDLADSSFDMVVENGILPTVIDNELYYLTVDPDHARRGIGVLAQDGSTDTIAVGDGTFDLDHLLAGTDGSLLHVAVLNGPDDSGGVTIGARADAHGNHDVPSSWWSVSAGGVAAASPSTSSDSVVVYDAASTGDAVVTATREGLSITSGATRTDLIASRAIRFVAG